MLPPVNTAPNNYKNSNKTLRRSSASSSASSTSSSPSPHPLTAPKSMEEVWKDITLSSFNHSCPRHHSSNNNTATTTTTFRNNNNNNNDNMSFQDFLTRPFNKDSSPHQHATTFPPSQNLPPTATALSLNSTHPQFQFLDNTSDTQPVSNVSSFSNPFDALAFSSGFPAFLGKRSSESDSSSGYRRHKRMIKNRESAARSRARKQAYTSQLEREVSQLTEENAKLRKQQEQLLYAAAQLPKKHKLHRTSTAPF